MGHHPFTPIYLYPCTSIDIYLRLFAIFPGHQPQASTCSTPLPPSPLEPRGHSGPAAC